MDKLREDFEAIPEIAERIYGFTIVFYKGQYIASGKDDDPRLWIALGYVGGAWMMWQALQDIPEGKLISSRAELLREIYNVQPDAEAYLSGEAVEKNDESK